jgi:hypothetical protein
MVELYPDIPNIVNLYCAHNQTLLVKMIITYKR